MPLIKKDNTSFVSGQGFTVTGFTLNGGNY